MKTFFRRSAISIIVIGMAGTAYATATPKAMDFSPQFTGAFIGVEGLNLRPQNGDLDYVTAGPTTSPGAFSTSAISPSYQWDWRVYGGIKFTDNDDITLSWMRMRNSETDSISAADGSFINATPRWLYNSNYSNVSGHVNFDLDDAYAVWGHTINFNNPWSVRLAAGVEYAKLDSDMTVTGNDLFFNDPSTAVGFTSDSSFKGVGPRAEVDLTYHLGYGFALFGNANAAALVSKRNVSLNPVVAEWEDATFFNSDFSERHVVIPKFGMRLGASYSYMFGQTGGEGPCRVTTLTLDAGWQAETYIHAIERPDAGEFEFSSSAAVAVQPSEFSFASTKTSNFSDQGLFVGIKLSSDWM